jgi:hypothetical protein
MYEEPLLALGSGSTGWSIDQQHVIQVEIGLAKFLHHVRAFSVLLWDRNLFIVPQQLNINTCRNPFATPQLPSTRP